MTSITFSSSAHLLFVAYLNRIADDFLVFFCVFHQRRSGKRGEFATDGRRVDTCFDYIKEEEEELLYFYFNVNLDSFCRV